MIPRLTVKQITAFALSMLLTVPSLASAPAEVTTYLTTAELGCHAPHAPGSAQCYQDLLATLQARGASNSSGYLLSYSKDGYTEYDFLTAKKPKTMIITIHGLWGNRVQFADVISELRNDDPSMSELGNTIQMTLPGHLKSQSEQTPEYLAQVNAHAPMASAHEWLVALDQTMRIASNAGAEVTMAGQSTGGLLAVIAALRFPKLVKRLVLVEPSLKVQDRWVSLSCNHGDALTTSSFLRYGERLLNKGYANTMNWKMGCEVAKLSNEVLAYYGKSTSAPAALTPDNDRLKTIASRIHQAVYLVNNEHDGIVVHEANKVFFDALAGPKRYQGFNFDGHYSHGEITGQTGMMTTAIAETILMTAPTLLNRQIYARTTLSALNDYVNYDIENWDKLENIKPWAISQQSLLSDAQLKRRLCEFSKTKADCLSMNKALDAVQMIYPQLLLKAHQVKTADDYNNSVNGLTAAFYPDEARGRVNQMQTDLDDFSKVPQN